MQINEKIVIEIMARELMRPLPYSVDRYIYIYIYIAEPASLETQR